MKRTGSLQPWRIRSCSILVMVAVAVLLGTASAMLSCQEALRLSDINEDRLLNRYPEYIVYLSHLSNNSSTRSWENYGTLSGGLQDTFQSFSIANHGDYVNITEAHGQQSIASPRLEAFCQQTQRHLENAEALVGSPQLDTTKRRVQDDYAHELLSPESQSNNLRGTVFPGSRPRSNQGDTVEDVPDDSRMPTPRRLSSDACSDFVQFSDWDNSGSLDPQEYLILTNLLANKDVAWTYQDLPQSFHNTFDILSSVGGEIWLEEQSHRRMMMNAFQTSADCISAERICEEIQFDIATLAMSTSSTMTLESSSSKSSSKCSQMNAALFDTDGVHGLSPEEYATFAKVVAQAPSDAKFLELPPTVQDIFFVQAVEERPLQAFLVGDNNHQLVVSFEGICHKMPQIVAAMKTGSMASQAPPRDDSTSKQNANDNTCTLQEVQVTLDLQLGYPDGEFSACDDQAQDDSIGENIAFAMTDSFTTTVTSWIGAVEFPATVNFDFDQEVNNADPFGGFRRRWLRSHAPRWLQEVTCPERTEDCNAEYCRWGCLNATVTNCDGSTTDDWSLLEVPIQKRLAGLGYDCLGIPGDIKVVLIATAPVNIQDVAAVNDGSGVVFPVPPPLNSSLTNQLVNATSSPRNNTANAAAGTSTALPFNSTNFLQSNNTILPQGHNTNTTATSSIAINATQANTTLLAQTNNTNATDPQISESETDANTTQPQTNVTSSAPSNITLPLLTNTTIPANVTTREPSGITPRTDTLAPTDLPLNTSVPLETPAPTIVNTLPQPVATTQPTTPAPATGAPITALPTSGAPTPIPVPENTTAPTPPQPTPAPGPTEVVTVYNSWILSNSLGKSAADIMADQAAFDDIKGAYAAFTEEIVADMAASRSGRLMLRRRRLAVAAEPGSSSVDSIVDSNCPATATASDKCSTAFGSVNLQVTDESTEDVSAEFEDTSQLAIDAGLMQQKLTQENPGSIFTVEGSSTPTNPEEGLPDPPPDEGTSDRGGSDLKLGLIVSGSVAAFLVIILCIFVITPAFRAKRELKQAKKDALEALRLAEANHEAAMKKKEKTNQGDKAPSGPPWPRKDHDEEDNPYREHVEDLILNNCPELIDELDSLLHQYQGREEELIVMLEDYKMQESLLLDDSDVDIESLSSSSLESESESVTDSVDEDVPVAEIEVEELPEPEVEVAQNIGDDEEEASEAGPASIKDDDDDDDEVKIEEPDPETSSSSSDSIINIIQARNVGGLEPPDEEGLEPEDAREGKALEPPGDDGTGDKEQLEPEDDDANSIPNEPLDEKPEEPPDDTDEETLKDPPEPKPEPKPDPEESERGYDDEDSIDAEVRAAGSIAAAAAAAEAIQREKEKEERLKAEHEAEQARLAAEQDAARAAEEERLKAEKEAEEARLAAERDAARKEEEERLKAEEEAHRKVDEERRLPAESVRTAKEERPKGLDDSVKKAEEGSDHETAHSDWLSDGSSEDGYQIKWFEKNGVWHAEKVWVGNGFGSQEFSETTDYYSSDSDEDESEEGQQGWKWVKSGRGWAKEHIQVTEGSLLDDSFGSSDSEDDYSPSPKWTRNNGQWEQEGMGDLSYSSEE